MKLIHTVPFRRIKHIFSSAISLLLVVTSLQLCFSSDVFAAQPPKAYNDAYTTLENTVLNVSAPGVLANDTDADGDPLTAFLMRAALYGSVTLNADGSFTYTPNLDYNGTDTFTYKANDGTADSNAATVTITITPVNSLPVANDDTYYTLPNNVLVVPAPGVLANDTDADSDPLTAIKVTDPTNGSLTFNADGSFTYTPNTDYTGSDSFTYMANDGTADSNAATVTITVTATNTPPVALDDDYSTPINTPLVVPAPGVLENDTDADDDLLNAIKVTDPTNGTVTLNTDGSFTYTPNTDYTGSDTFTYAANDGTADSNIATVTITVTATNTPPVALDDNYSTPKNTSLVVPAPGVLSNDTDADSNLLTTTKVTDPANGTLTLSSDGSFTYTPNTDYTGGDSFTYTANDGTVDSDIATVTISITSPPPSGGGGGGGGFGPPTPGVTSIYYLITESGIFLEDVAAYSGDRKCFVNILKDTLGVTKYNTALWEIRILSMDPQTDLPPDLAAISSFYDLGVEGATFNPPITISFSYKDILLTEGINEEDLVIVWRDKDGNWNVLESTVDTVNKIVAAEVDHFTPFVLVTQSATATSFTTSELKISPYPIQANQTATISVLVTNTARITGTYNIELKIDNEIADTRQVTLAGRSSETVTFTGIKRSAGTYNVAIGTESGKLIVNQPIVTTTILPPQKPAAFLASDLSITPGIVKPGDTATVNVLLTNTGDRLGTYTVVLKINGVAEDSYDITLGGNESKNVSFTLTENQQGTYAVNIDNLGASLVIEVPIEPTTEPVKELPKSATLPFSVTIGGILAGILSCFLTLLIMPHLLQPAKFKVSSIVVMPPVVKQGESARIIAKVTNTNNRKGKYKVILKVNDSVAGTQDLTLSKGSTESINFDVVKNNPGTYTVSIDDVSKHLSVEKLPETESSKTGKIRPQD